MNKFRIAHLVLWLGVFQIILILVSWLITAAMPELFVRSLLSSEGIRWFFGQFTSNIGTSSVTVKVVPYLIVTPIMFSFSPPLRSYFKSLIPAAFK